MAAKAPVKYRVNTPNAVAILFMASVIWALQILATLTVIGELVAWGLGIAQDLIYFFWFIILGVNYMEGKNAGAKMTALIGGDVGEASGLEFIPFSILQVGWLIHLSRKEDQERAALRAAEQEKKMLAERKRQEMEMRLRARQAANDNRPIAANDNEPEAERKIAA